MVLSAWKVSPRWRALPTLLLIVLFLSGCGGRVAVSGKVTVGDKPLTNGNIVFVPDRDKGNTSLAEPRGTIDDQGHYELSTDGKKGAPPGWYKVCVVSAVDAIPDIRKPTKTQSPIDERYATAARTDLSVEVPAGPFDFKLAAGSGSSGTSGTLPMPGVPPMPR
jgi:hypothetical protein